jgi:tRNA-modifying protein YgfZ
MKGRGKTTLNMRTPWNSISLDALGVLRARGPDARKFLQGQLSNDTSRLSGERALLAGYHNVQGRVIALVRLIELETDDFIAILPRELVSALVARLSRFILRAKVKLSDDSAAWQVLGILPGAHAEPTADPYALLLPPPGGVRQVAGAHIVRIGESPPRLLLVRLVNSPPLEGHAPLDFRDWQLAAIAAGEPQVYAATSEEFVSQMLNLDLLEGISFEKGCYTGQEVIARAHFRGRVKRRMQRFLTEAAAGLAPGDTARLADGRPLTVVEAVEHADGRCEFLAVTALSAGAEGAPEVSGARTLAAAQLPLPYALPD